MPVFGETANAGACPGRGCEVESLLSAGCRKRVRPARTTQSTQGAPPAAANAEKLLKINANLAHRLI
jgi:hypothetical protein